MSYTLLFVVCVSVPMRFLDAFSNFIIIYPNGRCYVYVHDNSGKYSTIFDVAHLERCDRRLLHSSDLLIQMSISRWLCFPFQKLRSQQFGNEERTLIPSCTICADYCCHRCFFLQSGVLLPSWLFGLGAHRIVNFVNRSIHIDASIHIIEMSYKQVRCCPSLFSTVSIQKQTAKNNADRTAMNNYRSGISFLGPRDNTLRQGLVSS